MGLRYGILWAVLLFVIVCCMAHSPAGACGFNSVGDFVCPKDAAKTLKRPPNPFKRYAPRPPPPLGSAVPLPSPGRDKQLALARCFNEAIADSEGGEFGENECGETKACMEAQGFDAGFTCGSPPPGGAGVCENTGQGGYTPAWHSTPSEAEVGMDGEQFFQSQWQRVIRMGADPPGFSFNTARAPDGTPALKGVIKKGGSYSQHVMGNQLGPTGQGDHVVASFEWYTPCSGGQTWNRQNGTYIGFGVWGSADGVNTFPGGSVNKVNDVAWNFRVALSKSNTYGAYAYLPGNTGSGEFWSTGVKPSCDRWERIDLEIIQNDIGKSNGVVRLYVNCGLIREETGIKTRVKANVRPKGFHMLLRHNSGTAQDEAYYWRNFGLSTK